MVTGANGQLGKELKRAAPSFPRFDFMFLSKGDLSIDDYEKVTGFLKTNQPQYCINCAAYTAVDKAEEEKAEAFGVNGLAVGILATVCKTYHTKLIQISTDYIFDGTSTVPYKEEAATHPQNVYGDSKLLGEQLALMENPEVIIIRTSWIYSEFGKNFVKTMLKLMNEKDEINVVNDQMGSPTYAADLANMILTIIANCHPDSDRESNINWTPGIYHYCNEGAISWYDFAMAIKELSGYQGRINPVSTLQYPTAAARPPYSVLDTGKIRHIFHVKTIPWKESLAACLARIRMNHS